MPLNNERLPLVKKKFPTKKLANYSPYFLGVKRVRYWPWKTPSSHLKSVSRFYEGTILNYVKLNSFWTCLRFGVNGTLVYRPYRGCVTLRKHIYITCKRQNHNFLSNKYTSQALNRRLNELWKSFRLTSFQKPISIRFVHPNQLLYLLCYQYLFKMFRAIIFMFH